MANLKESMEVLDFAETLAVKIIIAARDGINYADIALLLDKELWEKGKVAIEGINQVPEEFKNFSFDEAALLSVKAIEIAKHIIEATKKA